MKDKDILGYLKEKAQRFAEHGNKILMCRKIKQWGFITYYKKVADRQFYCKMWINGKKVREYRYIEADSFIDIITNEHKTVYSDDLHPKMPLNQEEYDEYINRRPNIASWNTSILNHYHQIWNKRLNKSY